MAFMNKIGSVLRQTQSSFCNASIYQAIRCFSSSKLFIGGLSYAADENSLRDAFAPYGEVVEARVIVDRETGQSRGFGFVSYPSAEEASAAIQALDGRNLHGRFIRVAYASDQRGVRRGPRFSSSTGYSVGFGGSSGYNVNNSQMDGNYRSGDGSYGMEQEESLWQGDNIRNENEKSFSGEDNTSGGYANTRVG